MGPQKKHILILSLSLVTLVNCGGSSNKGRAPAGGAVSAQELEEVALTTEQRAIATRICYAYQTKRSKFSDLKSGFKGSTFTFNTSTLDCSNQKKEFAVDTILDWNADNNLEFIKIDKSKTIISLVQTDTTGFISQLCTKIQNNEEISNTTVLAGRKVQVEFFRKNLDSYTIRTFLFVNNQQAFQFESADTFQVRTQFNVSGEQIVGMDEVITRQKVCPGSSTPTSSLFTQTYIKHVNAK